jgi:hypothetical protein
MSATVEHGYTPSSLESLHSGFEQLKMKMNGFDVDFDAFLLRQRERVIQEKSAYARLLVENRGRWCIACAYTRIAKGGEPRD